MGGRWGQEAAAHAGRLLGVLALAWQVRVRGLDAIWLHRAPVLMALDPHRMAWRAGQRGPGRRGERWREVRTHWPCLEHVIADGGQGRARGVTRAHAARGAHGEAAEPVSRQAVAMGRDVLPTQRERARVLPPQWTHAARQLDTARQAEAQVARDTRQGRDPRGVSGVAGRAWRKAARLVDQAGHAHEAVPPLPAALSWFAAKAQRAASLRSARVALALLRLVATPPDGPRGVGAKSVNSIGWGLRRSHTPQPPG